MNQIAIYQHPFVDIFQAFKVLEWTSSQKEGDIEEIYDKQVAKNVLKIAGATSASNYIQVPATKNLPKQSLGLTGKFVYLILNVPVSKQFVVHFDYVISDVRTVRISLSNLYKEFKNMNGSSLQVPLSQNLIPGKWTVVCMNVQHLLETNKVFTAGQPQKFSLRSFSVCATVHLKGVYTSDIQYTVMSLPKPMAIRIATGKDWFSEYGWISIPDVQIDHKVGQKENKNKSNLKKGSKLESKVSFEQEKTPQVELVVQELTEQEKYELEKQEQQEQILEKQKEVEECKRQGVERTVKEIDQLKKNYDLHLQSKHIKQHADVVLYQSEDFYDPNKSQRRNAESFVLKPDPIMALDRVLGVHPLHCAEGSFYNKDEKLASELLYTQANSFIGYHHKIQKQRLFMDKDKVSEILKFHVVRGYAITISKQANGKADLSGAPSFDLVMSVWDLDAEAIVIQTKPPLQSASNISMNSDQSALCLSGKDSQGRELILLYAFQELVHFQKVELLARQLADFQLVSLKFAENVASTLVGCGKENIRFFKIKNNFMPSQLVSMNNTSRGKTFNNSLVCRTDPSKKPSLIFVTTECGQLFIVNYFSRQIEKIIQLHDGPIQTLLGAEKFNMTASRSGNVKIWNGDFSKLVSEVSINQTVRSCDINVQNSEISILASDGTLSVLDLETSSFKVVMRSHQADLVEVCHNRLSGAIVSIGTDSSIKVWSAESLDQIHEFNTSANDPPTKVTSANHDDTIAVGFKSGFVRLFNLSGDKRQMYHETMIFESPVMDIQFSRNGKFMAAFYKNAKIVIFNIEKECKPVKNIDYEFPNSQHFSLSFSPDGAYLANISSNANTITVWETKNFSLRWYIDMTGEVLSKIQFAPNGRDLLALTTTSRLKYLRINQTSVEVETVREQYGLTDQETTDFTVSQNNKFIICSGKDGQIKVYDYFMRGKLIAAQQAFTGHFKFASRICLQDDSRYLYTVGQGNGIFRWSFYGDREVPADLTVLFEKTQNEIKREEEKENAPVILPTFKQSELKTYTEEQIGKLRTEMIDGRDTFAPQGTLALPRPHQDLLQDGGLSLKRLPKVEYTPAGYTFEQHAIELKKILGCSITPSVGNNIVWDQKHHCIVYSLQNIVVFEQLDQEKTQMLKQEFLDPVHSIQLSPDSRLVLAFTQQGKLEGYPQIIVWDTTTRKKVSQVTVEDYQINSVQFSNLANMLLVVSQDAKGKSSIIVWDFLEGRRDFLAKSIVPFTVEDVRWNPYIRTSADEFVSLCKNTYHYWRITNNLQMQYQAGRMPKVIEGDLTAITFVEPMQEQNSVYMLIGLSTGHVWVLDTRSNSFLHSAKVIDGAIHRIISSVSRIIVEGKSDTKIHSWELKKTIGDFDYDASDPDYFFAGKEKTITLDGYPSASHYDATAAEALFISTNNSIWLGNFIESMTVKLKSCHEPNNQLSAIDFKYVSPNEFHPSQNQDQNYIFDQNYLIGSTAQDGVVKVWNMFDLEHMLNFIVPKEKCTAIAMHQFKPFMICSFTDCYLRFFDLNEGRNLGRCLINTCEDDRENQDYVTNINILPSGNHVMCSTKYGQIFLIFVESWTPLSLTIHNLVSLNASIFSFDISYLEPYNKWLVSSSNGKVFVYNRQDCNSFKQELFDKAQPPNFIFMDSFNAQEYVENCFTEAKRVNTLDHYYNAAQRTLVYNEVNAENEVEACFLNNDLASYICYIRKCNSILVRNFELHQIVKKIDLASRAVSMRISPGSAPYVYIIMESGKIAMIDFVNESNTTEVMTLHEKVKSLKICPNGRYLITAGEKGDIAVWGVKRI